MRYKLLGLLLGVCLCFSLSAQVFDISTGSGTIGGMDNYWKVKLPGTTNFVSVPISGGNTYSPTDDCGEWISPFIRDASNGYRLAANGTVGNYVYQREFNLPACATTQATLDLSFVLADNYVQSITVNGSSVPLPAAQMGPNTASSLNESITVIPNAVNKIQVTVRNVAASSGTPETATGLQLCGSVILNSNATSGPEPADCCWSAAGQVISWSPYNGTSSYEVSLVYNDPTCCMGQNVPPMYEQTFMTTDNLMILPSLTACYSWTVQAILPNGCRSAISAPTCSCPNNCEPPTEYGCQIIGNAIQLYWDNVTGVFNYEIEITWEDPECCGSGFGFEPSSIIYSSQTNGFTVPVETLNTCFSWRVRAQCQDEILGAWGPRQCSGC